MHAIYRLLARRNPATLQNIGSPKQEAINRVQGLLAGLGLLEELEGEGISVPHNLSG